MINQSKKLQDEISFDEFTEFMINNYRFEYDGLQYEPDFGKIIRKLDRE